MKPILRFILRCWLLAILVVSLFPPCLKTTSYEADRAAGHYFLFAIDKSSRVNPGQLLAWWGAITSISALAWTFSDERIRRPQKARSTPKQSYLQPVVDAYSGIEPSPGFPGIVSESADHD